MFRLFRIATALASVILAGVSSAKLIVSPSLALARAARRVAARLSAMLVTVIVAARRLAGVAHSANRRLRATVNGPMVLEEFVFTPDSATSAGENDQQRERFLERRESRDGSRVQF